MMRGRVKRLAQMDAAEIRWRVRTGGRAMMDRVTTGLITPTWKREHLRRSLVALPELSAAREALARFDWRTAHTELARYLSSQPQRFVLGPGSKSRVVNSILGAFPGSASHAVAGADRILDGRYDLLGYRGLRFAPASPAIGSGSRRVDWHFDPVNQRRAPRVAWPSVRFLDPSCGDHKIIWELNRHQHWLTLGRAFWLTGEQKYRDRCVIELLDWLDANPPLLGINWASMLELAFRTLSWTWAISLFAGDERDARQDDGAPWLVDLLLALDLQLTHIENHLSSYFSPNTHLLGEALALYVCGTAVPALTASARRVETGRRILLAEVSRQIGSDGGHLERSTHYHRYVLDFYLLALIVARINRDPAAAEFERAVSRLASAARLLADDRGRVPHIGDDDGGMLTPITGRPPDDLRDSLAIAATLLERPELSIGGVPEEACWLLAHETFEQVDATPAPAASARVPSGALEETGYYISRSAAADHLVIDGGPHGYQNGGHAHADALSLTFSVHGLPLFIDPGTGCYTSDAGLRDRFRSTALHNTVTVDGRPSSVTNGPFHWSQVANSRVLRWQTSAAFDYFDGEHDGYRPITHRRRILAFHGDLLIVADTVDGSGTHETAIHWHIDPAWSAHVQGRRTTLRRDGHDISLTVPEGTVEAFTADRDSGLGWHSPAYGRVEPATTLRVVRRGPLPVSIVTVIGLNPRNEVRDVSRMPAPAAADGRPAASLLTIRRASSIDYLLLAGGSTAGADTLPPVTRIGDLETDARMLFYRLSSGRSVSRLAFVDGSIVRSTSGRGLRLEMPAAIPHYFSDFNLASRKAGRRTDPQAGDHNTCVA
jgi:Heparinase II/III-like protein/Heparinase II/III N-terminus